MGTAAFSSLRPLTHPPPGAYPVSAAAAFRKGENGREGGKSMAVFYNQATISYGGTVRQSNIASGEILDAVSVTKSSLIGTYAQGDTLTYVVNIVNESGPPGPGVPRRNRDSAYDGWDPSDRWAQGNPYFA